MHTLLKAVLLLAVACAAAAAQKAGGNGNGNGAGGTTAGTATDPEPATETEATVTSAAGGARGKPSDKPEREAAGNTGGKPKDETEGPVPDTAPGDTASTGPSEAVGSPAPAGEPSGGGGGGGKPADKPGGGRGKPTGSPEQKPAGGGGKPEAKGGGDEAEESAPGGGCVGPELSGEGSGSGSASAVETTVSRAVKIQGQSGKFTLYDSSLGPGPQCDPGAIKITMDALYEIGQDGGKVGSSGAVKHSINTFAAQNFAVGESEPASLDNVPAAKVPFSTPIKGLGDAKLEIDTYLITGRGEVGTPTERWVANPGDLKFNIVLSSWEWCGCSKGQTNEVGAFIDVVITVQRDGATAAPRVTATKEVTTVAPANDETDNAVGAEAPSATDAQTGVGGPEAETSAEAPAEDPATERPCSLACFNGGVCKSVPLDCAAPDGERREFCDCNPGGIQQGSCAYGATCADRIECTDLAPGTVACAAEAIPSGRGWDATTNICLAAEPPAGGCGSETLGAAAAGRQRQRRQDTPATIGLGDLDLKLSNQVRVDGAWVDMPTGFPRVELKGDRVTCTFRFPRFETEGFYDPLISQAEPESDATAEGGIATNIATNIGGGGGGGGAATTIEVARQAISWVLAGVKLASLTEADKAAIRLAARASFVRATGIDDAQIARVELSAEEAPGRHRQRRALGDTRVTVVLHESVSATAAAEALRSLNAEVVAGGFQIVASVNGVEITVTVAEPAMTSAVVDTVDIAAADTTPTTTATADATRPSAGWLAYDALALLAAVTTAALLG